MFALLRALLASSAVRAERPSNSSPERSRSVPEVAFHPQLIAELCQSQHQLQERFRSLVTHYLNDNQGACTDALDRFDNELRNYMVREGLQFETYMQCVLADDPRALTLMRTLRARLRGIAKYVHDVAELHRAGMLPDNAYRSFGRELPRLDSTIAESLKGQREQLFPRYCLLNGHPTKTVRDDPSDPPRLDSAA